MARISLQAALVQYCGIIQVLRISLSPKRTKNYLSVAQSVQACLKRTPLNCVKIAHTVVWLFTFPYCIQPKFFNTNYISIHDLFQKCADRSVSSPDEPRSILESLDKTSLESAIFALTFGGK